MDPMLKDVSPHPQNAKYRVEIPHDDFYRELIKCQSACPVRTDARGYVRAVAEGRFEEAYLIARGPNPFASICGRICGAPCEAACRRGLIPRTDDDGNYVGNDHPIAIRALKSFASRCAGLEVRPPSEVWEASRSFIPGICSDTHELAALIREGLRGKFDRAGGQRVAIIGAGPAGLSAAHDLALMGFRPVVFETESVPAGMLMLGVPGYRLPRELIRREVAVIEALGVEIRCGTTIGKNVSFEEIRRNYPAVIIAVGAKRSRGLGLPGEHGPYVYGGVDLLRAVALGKPIDVGKTVLVIGGGNVAYDVARTVLRQEAYDAARTAARFLETHQVVLASLETLEEMPADTAEIIEGDEEGIVRMNGWGPVEVQRDTDGSVKGVLFRKCIRVYDNARRFAPSYDEAVRKTVSCDTVLFAAGQTPDLAFLDEGGRDVEEIRPGWPKSDPETLSTTAEGVFVAGDLAHGTRLLIDAVASGKQAARSVYRYLTGETMRPEAVESFITCDRYRREPGYETIRRLEIPTLRPDERLIRPDAVVEVGYSETEARLEASRCLDCGISPVFDSSRCVLCGGCVDVCPTLCLRLLPLDAIDPDGNLDSVSRNDPVGSGDAAGGDSAIIKNEDCCIRCGLCAMRCPTDAISMERFTFRTNWRIS
jgi:formate dehydrogenase beta subunit